MSLNNNFNNSSADVSFPDMTNMSSDRNITFRELPAPPEYIVVTATLFYILIFIVGILGNILVILVINLGRLMNTSVNMYLLNLCVADLLVLIVCMPTALAEIYTKEVWYFGEFMCKWILGIWAPGLLSGQNAYPNVFLLVFVNSKIVPFLENTVANSSVLTIIAISVERFRVVCNPLSGIEEKRGKILKIIIVIWILAAGACFPYFVISVYRRSTLIDGTPVFVCRMEINETWKRVYCVMSSSLFFLFPSCILFGLYCHLCRMLKRSTDPTNLSKNVVRQVNYLDRKRLHRQVLNIIACIVVIFFICHMPFRVVMIYFIFGDKRQIGSLGLESYLNILYSTRIMFYTNHALNPIVYNFVSSKFRAAITYIITKRKDRYTTTNSRGNPVRMTSLKRLNEKQVRTYSKKKLLSSNTNEHDHLQRSCSSHSSKDERQKRNDFMTNYADHKLIENIEVKQGSSSGSSDYDVKIKVHDKTVSIKFLNSKKPV